MAIYIAPRTVSAPAVKAGPIGSGAGVLLTEYPLFSFLGKDPHTKMRTAYQIGWNTPWVRTAERAIGSKVSTVDFDLNDPEGVEITATYPNPDAVAAWALLDKPQALLGVGQPLSRSSLLRLWSRHVGLAGNSFFLQDSPEVYAGTPKAIAYLRPDRLTPNDDSQGNLKSWQIDKTPQSAGIEVSLEQLVHFMLEPPDSGHFGVGLVETALMMAQLSTNLDKHLASVLSAGGRLSGFVSPKTGVIQGEQLLRMEQDWRTITEQPDAAKRIQLIAAPIDFQQTTMSPEQLAIVDLMKLMRDDLFVVWNVPGTIVGVSHATGLNGGESRKYDEAALWQGPVHDRLIILGEGLQDSILSKWEKRMGWAPDLILEEPEFDDDSPRFDLLKASENTAMRDRERRALIGLDPFGPQVVDALGRPIDDLIRLPALMVEAGYAPDDPATIPQQVTSVLPSGDNASDAALGAAGETTAGKATLHPRVEPLRRSLLALRDSIATHHTPRIKEAVANVLQEQRSEIASRIRARASHITANPKDTSVWWDGKRWDRALSGALVGGLVGMATSVSRQVNDVLPPTKADPISAVDKVIDRGAARVTKINVTTKDAITGILAQAVEQGVSITDIADALEEGTDLTPLIGSNGGIVGDLSYRAEMIARTELMDAYNASALYSYSDAGVQTVQAIDGDGDPECAERDGMEFSVEEADLIEDHPNGTLDWVPVLDFAPQKAELPKSPLMERMDALVAAMHEQTTRVQPAPTFVINQAPSPDVHIHPAAVSVYPPNAPEINVSPPNVTVEAAQITVEPAPVILPAAKATTKKVIRDGDGNIIEVREE